MTPFAAPFAAPFGAAGYPSANVPQMPAVGSHVADLDTLRAYVGAKSRVDDILLNGRLIVAREWVYERTMSCEWDHPDVQEAVLLLASRLYKRRQSPEGTAGFGGEGVVVRILASDPDIRALIERHADLLNIGIG